MTTARTYELLDAGDGRRLERLGGIVVDRPAPGATDPRRDAASWTEVGLRFDRDAGWTGEAPDPWTLELDGLTLELRATPAGQVGVFPEHTWLWPWFHDILWDRPGAEVLHLFAHTGATTLALAREGARVTHVDASRPAVRWARRNAELSGATDRPIRWIVDDVEAYVGRELHRGRRYAGIVLDPPSYGHGPGGKPWELDQRLPELLRACGALLAGASAFILLTTHASDRSFLGLSDALEGVWPRAAVEAGAGDLEIRARSGATLRLGAYARIMAR